MEVSVSTQPLRGQSFGTMTRGTKYTFCENGVLISELDEVVKAASETDDGEQEEETAGDVDDEREERGEVHDCTWRRGEGKMINSSYVRDKKRKENFTSAEGVIPVA